MCDASTQTESGTEENHLKSHGSSGNASSNEDEATVCISQREYSRLLKIDFEFIKANVQIRELKNKCDLKAKQIKQLQDTLSYYKKKSDSTEHSPQ